MFKFLLLVAICFGGYLFYSSHHGDSSNGSSLNPINQLQSAINAPLKQIDMAISGQTGFKDSISQKPISNDKYQASAEAYAKQLVDLVNKGDDKTIENTLVDQEVAKTASSSPDTLYYLMGKEQAKFVLKDVKVLQANEGADGKATSILVLLNTDAHYTDAMTGTTKDLTDKVFYMTLDIKGDKLLMADFHSPNADEIAKQNTQLQQKYDAAKSTIDTLSDFTPQQQSTTTQTNPTPVLDTTSFVKTIVQQDDSRVVKVLVQNDSEQASGSGFFIQKGIVATNYHVIDGMTSGVVLTTDGKQHKIVGLVSGNPKIDIAIVKIEDESGDPVVIGDTASVEKGDSAVAIGSPKGFMNTVSTGIISNIWSEEGVKTFQISIPITHGSSGGALFNTKGEVIGITSSGLETTGDLNFAISAEYLKPVLSQISSMPFSSIPSTDLSQLKK